MPHDDPPERSRPNRQFPNAGLMAAGSPFVDDNGQNPFSDADSPEEAASTEVGQNNAYAAHYADGAAEQPEFFTRLAHRGSTLILVAILTAFMALISMAVGTTALIVVFCLGFWCFFSGLSDLSKMKVGRMNDVGRWQTTSAVFLSGIALAGAISAVVYQIYKVVT